MCLFYLDIFLSRPNLIHFVLSKSHWQIQMRVEKSILGKSGCYCLQLELVELNALGMWWSSDIFSLFCFSDKRMWAPCLSLFKFLSYCSHFLLSTSSFPFVAPHLIQSILNISLAVPSIIPSSPGWLFAGRCNGLSLVGKGESILAHP